jgi:hypothetical protein
MRVGSTGVGTITKLENIENAAEKTILAIDDTDKMLIEGVGFEADLLSNKHFCPNGHELIISICSCSPNNLLQRKFVFYCEEVCEYNSFVSLDCGKNNCEKYTEPLL